MCDCVWAVEGRVVWCALIEIGAWIGMECNVGGLGSIFRV